MAVKQFGVNASGVVGMAETAGPTAGFAAVQAATTTALAVSGLDAVTGATVAVTAIGTASAAVETALVAQPINVLINGALTRKQIFDGLDAIKAHINSNNLYAQGS